MDFRVSCILREVSVFVEGLAQRIPFVNPLAKLQQRSRLWDTLKCPPDFLIQKLSSRHLPLTISSVNFN